MGLGGARRRTRRRMMAVNEIQNSKQQPETTESSETIVTSK